MALFSPLKIIEKTKDFVKTQNRPLSSEPKDVPLKVLTTLAEFYIANKQEQSEWVILPVTNIGAYLGSSSLGRQYLSKIPPELMERKQSSFGASVYKMRI